MNFLHKVRLLQSDPSSQRRNITCECMGCESFEVKHEMEEQRARKREHQINTQNEFDCEEMTFPERKCKIPKIVEQSRIHSQIGVEDEKVMTEFAMKKRLAKL